MKKWQLSFSREAVVGQYLNLFRRLGFFLITDGRACGLSVAWAWLVI